MDREVDEMSKAYQAYADATASYLRSIQISRGQKNLLTNIALENVKIQYDAFKAICDQAEAKIDDAKRRLIAGYLDSAANLVGSSTKKKKPTVIGSSSSGKGDEKGDETEKCVEDAAMKDNGEASGAVKSSENGIHDQ